MILCSLDDTVFENQSILRNHLLNFTQTQGGNKTRIVEAQAPIELSSLVKDCFTLVNVPDALHPNHFGSEIDYCYMNQGYRRIRTEDKSLRWYERGNVREAVDIRHAPNDREATFVIIEYNRKTSQQ